MRLNRAFFIKGLIFTAAGLAVAASAAVGCSSESRPGAGASSGLIDGDGAIAEGGGSVDGSTDGDSEAAPLPETCTNTVRDGNETAVDCGGNVCSKCIDGKDCIANTDCAGGACLEKICTTPVCTNKVADGDETDQDCGGAICAKCTIGKRCKNGTDCVSGACTNSVCRCPQGMTEVSRAGGGGAYCIDEIEVTKYQYNRFITSNWKTDDQIDVCKPPTNNTYVPRSAWPPAAAPPYLQQAGAGLNFNNALPVHYVDWCDAHAYCRWANKQLCGSVTGGKVEFDKANQADAGAWYNACSAQGANDWPYGEPFEPGRCNGHIYQVDGGPYDGVGADAGSCGPIDQQRNGFGCGGANKDYGVHYSNNGGSDGKYNIIYFGACAGGVTGLYHMSGNVAEWEDSCDSAAANANCRIRGGSYQADEVGAALRCDATRLEQRVPTDDESLADVGFRCCLY